MKRSFLILLLLLFIIQLFSNDLIKTKPAPWINIIQYSKSDSLIEEDYQYLLLDYQYNLIKDEYYFHIIVELINNQGVQDFSNLDLEFDPTYEKLELNSLQIYREGKKIDKYSSATISVVQRESDFEYAIYDGRKSALILLNDIRQGDILEYSYTISGSNPINKHFRSGLFYQEYGQHINRIYNRLISDKNQGIKIKKFNEAKSPDTKVSSKKIEYVWDIRHSGMKLNDSNYPAWYDPYKRIAYSNYNGWEEVVNWALPLYEYDQKSIKSIIKELQTNNEINSDIISVVRFVQNKIRYFGIEGGVNAFKPQAPKIVFNQRFGDCKGKSLLLVALLRNLGYESYPVLVNYNKTKGIINDLPTKSAFNHLVVYIKNNGLDYYVDATTSNQGGDIDHIYFPDYGYGLMIRKGETGLTKLPKPAIPKIKIHETFTMDSIGGGGFLHIKSIYSGSKADYIRDDFDSQTKSEISKAYLDFYSNLYPNIQLHLPIEIKDASYDTKNEFELNEYYRINQLWEITEDGTTNYIETYPLVLESFLTYKRTANRSMPFYCGETIDFEQISQLIMSEDWNVESKTNEINHEAFTYKNKMYSKANEVFFSHKYIQTETSVDSSQIQSFFDKQEKITADLSFSVLYTPENGNFSFSWLSLIIIVITSILGYFIVRKLNKFDPEPKNTQEEITTISGWLVLPMIGLWISPFTLGYQVFANGFLDHNTWISTFNYEQPQSLYIIFLILLELITNVLLMAYLLLILYLFVKRRSSLPKLISVFYALNFIIPLIDITAVELLGLTSDNDGITQIVRSFIAMSIWIPYFILSNRSKNTFVNRYIKKSEATN